MKFDRDRDWLKITRADNEEIHLEYDARMLLVSVLGMLFFILIISLGGSWEELNGENITTMIIMILSVSFFFFYSRGKKKVYRIFIRDEIIKVEVVRFLFFSSCDSFPICNSELQISDFGNRIILNDIAYEIDRSEGYEGLLAIYPRHLQKNI